MTRLIRIVAATACAVSAGGLALPAAAQDQPAGAAPAQAPAAAQGAGTPAAGKPEAGKPEAGKLEGGKPEAGKPEGGATPQEAPKAPVPVAPTDPNLAVATVRLEGGYRASKVIGAAVYNAQNQQIGAVDDLIMNHANQAQLAVISVGGFLGVGGKLVALPYGKLERAENGRVILADGSKDNLLKLPNFTYAP